MAIKPSSDLVLDVIKAADPTRAAAVERQLNSISAAQSGQGFDAALLSSSGGATSNGAGGLYSGSIGRLQHSAEAEAARVKRVRTEFEASILGTFVGQILPKDNAAMFGTGMAGDMWRSLLSEQVAKQMAKAGSLHIVDTLFKTHPFPGSKRNPLGDIAPAAAQMSANALSAPSGAVVRDGSIAFAHKPKA